MGKPQGTSQRDTQSGKPPQDAARKGALRLIAGVREGLSLSDQPAALARLAPADRARAQRLALAVLRNIDRADTLLVQHLSKKPRPEVLDVLRLGTVELLEMGEAPHGAMVAAVGLVQSMGPKGRAASGMVNAVLRKIADQRDIWPTLPPEEMPDWLRDPIAHAWGNEAVLAIEAAHQAGAPVDFSVKPGKDGPGAALPTGSYRLAGQAQISALPGYAEGDWWVQDAAAAMAVRLLDPRPGEVVVDLCAAPGGKTLQLAAAGAQVTAVDISGPRLTRLRENLDRCGLDAQVVEADALEWLPETAPDAILLDAPCSATGIVRRQPDVLLHRRPEDLVALTALQARLLEAAWHVLRPGGRLVYATCSLLRKENAAQIDAFRARHSDARVEPLGEHYGHADGAGRQRLPGEQDMDGFFYASMRKA